MIDTYVRTSHLGLPLGKVRGRKSLMGGIFYPSSGSLDGSDMCLFLCGIELELRGRGRT